MFCVSTVVSDKGKTSWVHSSAFCGFHWIYSGMKAVVFWLDPFLFWMLYFNLVISSMQATFSVLMCKYIWKYSCRFETSVCNTWTENLRKAREGMQKDVQEESKFLELRWNCLMKGGLLQFDTYLGFPLRGKTGWVSLECRVLLGTW